MTVLPLKIGPKSCSETLVTTNLRCVTSQKSEDVTIILKFDAVVDTVDTQITLKCTANKVNNASIYVVVQMCVNKRAVLV
jgi:hypothetical protein